MDFLLLACKVSLSPRLFLHLGSPWSPFDLNQLREVSRYLKSLICCCVFKLVYPMSLVRIYGHHLNHPFRSLTGAVHCWRSKQLQLKVENTFSTFTKLSIFSVCSLIPLYVFFVLYYFSALLFIFLSFVCYVLFLSQVLRACSFIRMIKGHINHIIIIKIKRQFTS